MDAATVLIDRMSECLVTVATGGPRIDLLNDGYKRDRRALDAVLTRLGLSHPHLFTDLWQWHAHYSRQLPTYAERRAYVANLFETVHRSLEQQRANRQRTFESPAWERPTGWSDLDAKLSKLRRDFAQAACADDFRAVGLLCISTLEALSEVVFDAERDLVPGEESPRTGDTSARLEAFFSSAACGARYEHVRALVRPARKQAEAAKHRPTTNETDAGIAASAVALIVQVARQLDAERRKSAVREAA
jgi:hypothetical protein